MDSTGHQIHAQGRRSQVGLLQKFAAFFRLELRQMSEFKMDFYFFWVESLIKAGIMSFFWWQMWSYGDDQAASNGAGFSDIDRQTFMFLLLGTQVLQLPYRGSERISQMLEEPTVTGRMALVLCRPIHPLLMNLARVSCQQMRLMVLALGILGLLLHFGFPAMGLESQMRWEHFPWMLLSLSMGMLVNFFLFSALGAMSFWVGYVWSLLYVVSLFSAFLSGQYFPLHVDGNLEFWSRFLPFRYIAYSPVLVGSGLGRWEELGLQAMALGICAFFAFWIYGKGVSKFEAAGG